MIKMKLVVLGLFVASLALTSISFAQNLDLFKGEEILPGVTNFTQAEKKLDFEGLVTTANFIKGEIFKIHGISPNTPVTELGKFGSDIQPILDILNNPEEFRALAEQGKVIDRSEFQTINVPEDDYYAVVVRRFIELGDITIRLVYMPYSKGRLGESWSEDLYSMQVTEGESTKGIIFNREVFTEGSIITTSIVYSNEGHNIYPVGSIEPTVPTASPGNYTETDPLELWEVYLQEKEQNNP